MKRKCIVSIIAIAIILILGTILYKIYGNSEIVTYKKYISDIVETSKKLDMTGQWQGKLYNKDDLIISINEKTQEVKVTSSNRGYYNFDIYSWQYDGEVFTLLLNHKLYYEIFKLNLKDNNLVGKYIWDNKECDITFEMINKKASNREKGSNEFNFELKEYGDFIKDNSNYKGDETSFNFKYEIGNKEKYKEIIEKYNLNEKTEGKSDVELMIALMDFVCDNFPHSSMGTVEATTLDEVIKYSDENGGLNCKELSYMLAELLRAYGIEAKYIRCFPNQDLFNDCHVVVHAYSSKYNQWIMIDPTYRLMLKDKSGKYLNIESYREWIGKYSDVIENMDESDENYLISNEGAGYTGQILESFNLKEYTAYMAKNLAVIQCSEENIIGTRGNESGNETIYLVSEGYTKVGQYSIVDEDCVNIITTDKEKFYTLPLK